MLKIYGSMLCKDCVACTQELTRAGVAYEFLDFGEKLSNLKEFLVLRDTDPAFDGFRGQEKIGIPCIVREDGSVSLEWSEFLPM